MRRIIGPVLLVALVAAGCGESTEGGADGTPDEVTTVAPVTSDAPETTYDPPRDEGEQEDQQVPPSSRSAVESAVADLAARLGVEASEVVLISQEEVTWRDGSIGCPEPGMSYTQALVAGTRVLLEVDGKRFAYHSSVNGEPFYCENPVDPYEGDSPDV